MQNNLCLGRRIKDGFTAFSTSTFAVCLKTQVPGDVLQGVPGHPAARQPLHQPVLHDAGLGHAGAAVVRRHRLHQEDAGPGQVGAGGPGLLHEADERRPPRRLDHQDGLDFPHDSPARHELRSE